MREGLRKPAQAVMAGMLGQSRSNIVAKMSGPQDKMSHVFAGATECPISLRVKVLLLVCLPQLTNPLVGFRRAD